MYIIIIHDMYLGMYLGMYMYLYMQTSIIYNL